MNRMKMRMMGRKKGREGNQGQDTGSILEHLLFKKSIYKVGRVHA